MKIILLVAGGRTGNEFFHSLLDSHSEILQFPGILVTDNNFVKMIEHNEISQIPKIFISLFPQFFDSRLNKIERMNKLGLNKKKFFNIDKKKFCNNFNKLMKDTKDSDKIGIIKNLHLAYSNLTKTKIKKPKIMIINPHLIKYTKNFINNFGNKNTEIICTIRHPLSALSSQIINNLNYKNGSTFLAKDLYKSFEMVFKDFYKYLKLCKVRVVKLENIHLNHKKVFLDFCKTYNLKYEKTLNRSTFLGLQWWGDAISKKWLKGINKNFQVKIREDLFFKKDLYFFQTISKTFFKSYKYKYLIHHKNCFLKILPLKSELIVWKNSFRHVSRLKNIISIPLYYFLRIVFINKFFIEKKKMPYSFGDK